MSQMGCIGALVVLAAGGGLALAAFSPHWLAIWLLILPVLAFDPGGWHGDWKTLGSLARSVAVRNVAYFAGKGARNRDGDWWRSLSHLLAGIVVPAGGDGEIEPRQIRPDTRFRFN